MKLRIVHATTFAYDAPVTEGYTEVRLRPLDSGGQRCLAFRLAADPAADVRQRVDRLGNDVRYFDVLAPHDRLVVTATSEVSTPDAFADGAAGLTPLDRFDYLAPSAYAPFSDGIRAFAADARAGDGLETARRLLAAIRDRLTYQKGATDVSTSADQALARGRGVCQDFAHLMLAGCRLLGIPSRYVSGYVHAPADGMGAASHAWADVFIDGLGWISLDPTVGAPQSGRHVRVAVGRDYSDVPPTRGVYKGSAKETLSVEVRVEESPASDP